jgi:hypothetical protein
MKRDIPKYKITIDDEYSDGEKLGIEKIAHTARPAIKVKGIAFSDANLHPNCKCELIDGKLKTEVDACDYCLEMKSKEFSFHTKKSYGFADEPKMRIAAPLMIPGEIYRSDEIDGEHYVEFTIDEIENIHKDFMKNLTNKEIYNEEHDNTRISDKSYLLEALLIDTDNKVKMIKDDYGIDVPKGTLFTITQIEDKEYYDYLVENDMLGLSLEGFLGLKLSEQKNKKQIMSKKVQRLSKKNRFSAKVKFEDAVVIEDVTIVAEEIKEGQEVLVIDENLQVVEDYSGEVEVNGMEVTIEEGVIAEVSEEVIETELEDEVKKEELEDEVKKEELEDEAKKEELEDEKKVELTEEEVMKFVQPKIDEVLEMIADIKASMLPEGEKEGEEKKEFKFSETEIRARKAMRLSEILKK